MVRAVTRAALALGLILGLTGGAGAQGQLRMKPVDVIDAQGFGRPLVAFSLMVPHHWREQGGVVWGNFGGCNRSGYNFDWRSGLPDDSEGVAILPALSWQSQPGGPCPQMQVSNARDFLATVAAQSIPGAQVIDYRQRPDLLTEMQGVAGRQDYGSMAYETAVDAGEALIAFQQDGREMRASVIAQIMMWRLTTPEMYGLPGQDIRGGASNPGFVAAAPAGRLNLQVAEAIRKSIRPGPEWQRQIAQHHAVLSRQNTQHASAMSRINSQASNEIMGIINDGYQQRRAIEDRGQRERVEAIRGVETYNDAVNGGTVQLDNTYEHAWQLDDGTYLLTNDSLFNPGVELGLDGQLLRVTP
ncbi:hypothetical protein [Amaricoccus macauensis]|uniref:hypothetical protein n=1 Tax=Amaricoccus macauensis TaxID=57001 RepID=UPI003C7A226A